MCLSPLFSVIFLSATCYSKRVEIPLYHSLGTATLSSQFYTSSWVLFVDIFLIFWPFIYSTLNKRCLETRSCVCVYWACRLFLQFRSLRNISRKRQGIRGGPRAILCRSQWVGVAHASAMFWLLFFNLFLRPVLQAKWMWWAMMN